MKHYALAVMAAAASALETEHGSGWSFQPPTKSYQPPTTSYQPPTTSYQQPRSGYQAPVHVQTKGYLSSPSQFSSVAAPSYSYGNSYYHQPNHAHNPFEYSRPQIPYVAAKLHAPVYAKCCAVANNTYALRFG